MDKELCHQDFKSKISMVFHIFVIVLHPESITFILDESLYCTDTTRGLGDHTELNMKYLYGQRPNTLLLPEDTTFPKP